MDELPDTDQDAYFALGELYVLHRRLVQEHETLKQVVIVQKDRINQLEHINEDLGGRTSERN